MQSHSWQNRGVFPRLPPLLRFSEGQRRNASAKARIKSLVINNSQQPFCEFCNIYCLRIGSFRLLHSSRFPQCTTPYIGGVRLFHMPRLKPAINHKFIVKFVVNVIISNEFDCDCIRQLEDSLPF